MHLLALFAQLLVIAAVLGSPAADFDSRESYEVPYRAPLVPHRPKLPSYPRKGLTHRIVASFEDSREDFSDERYYPSRPIPSAGVGISNHGQDPYPAALPQPLPQPLPLPQPQPVPQPYPASQPVAPQSTDQSYPAIPSQSEPNTVLPISGSPYPAPIAAEVAIQEPLPVVPEPTSPPAYQTQSKLPQGISSSAVIKDPAEIPPGLQAYIASHQKRYSRDYSGEYYFNPASRPGVKYHYGQSALYIRDRSEEDSYEVGIAPVVAIQSYQNPSHVNKPQVPTVSAAALPVSVDPVPVQVPSVPSFEDVLATTREGNARIDAILKVLAADGNSLSKVNLKINELPSTLRIHRWAYRRIPFSFRIPEHPLYGIHSGESFETVDDDYLTRFPVPHPTRDGKVNYHLQLVEEDDADFLRLFEAGLLPQTVKLTKRSSETADKEPAAAEVPASTKLETVQVQEDLVPSARESAPAQDEVVPVQDAAVPVETEQVSKVEEAAPAQNDYVASQAEGVPAQESTIPIEGSSIPAIPLPAVESSTADYTAILTGLNLIRRTSNVRVFQQYGTKSIHVPVIVGPLQVEILDSASNIPRGTSILARPMKAILALEETGGKVTSLQLFGARRMALHYSQVTLSRTASEGEPDWTMAGRLVTHLSLEMARLWNQGSLVDQVNAEMKKIAANSGKAGYQKNKYY